MRRPVWLVPPAVLLAAGLVLAAHGPAGALTPRGTATGPPPDGVHVVATDDVFTPPQVDVPRGGSVVWDWTGPSHHTATDITGMDLYDFSAAAGDPSNWFTYQAAGNYNYYCVLHTWMGGRVSVPMRAAPAMAGVHHAFVLTWATVNAPTGFAYDVQVHRPGRGWGSLLNGVSTRQGTFTPDAGTGTYRFRARMRRLAGGAARWSDAVTIQAG